MSEEELSRLAREEILREAHSASARAEEVGPQGWMKCPIPPANKRFLHNTLRSTLPRETKRDSYTSHRHTRSKSGESRSRHRDKGERNSDKHERRDKRPRSKDYCSKSPKCVKLESRTPTEKKCGHSDREKNKSSK